MQLSCWTALWLSLLLEPFTSGTLFEYRLRCPDTSDKWQENSDSYICDGDSVYHCMQDQEGRYVVFCASSIWIQPDYCPEFNLQSSMMDVALCRGATDKCPDTVYLSNTIYKFPGCFWSPQRTTHRPQLTASPQNSTYSITSKAPFIQNSGQQDRQNEPVGWILGGIVVPITIIIVLVVIFWYRRKPKQKRTNNKPFPTTDVETERVPMIEEDPVKEEVNMIEEGFPGKGPIMHTNEKEDNQDVVQNASETNYKDSYFEPRQYRKIVDTLQTEGVVLLQGNSGSGKTATANYIAQYELSDYQILNMKPKATDSPEIHGDKTLIIWDNCFGLWKMAKGINKRVLENLHRVIKLTKDNSEKIHAIVCVDTFYLTEDHGDDWKKESTVFNLEAVYEAQIDKEKLRNFYKEDIRIGRVSKDVGFPLLINLIHARFCPREDCAKFLEDPYTYIRDDIDRLCEHDCDCYVTLVYAVCNSPEFNLNKVNEAQWKKIKKECHGYNKDNKLKPEQEQESKEGEPLDPNIYNCSNNEQVEGGMESSSACGQPKSRNRGLMRIFTKSRHDSKVLNETLERYLLETEEASVYRFRHQYLAECVLKFHIEHFGTKSLLKTSNSDLATEIKQIYNT